MIDPTGQEKVKRFVADRVMFEAVLETIERSFLKPCPFDDLHTLAASRIALDLLRDARKELEKMRPVDKSLDKKAMQVGL